MPISFSCNECKTPVRVNDNNAGKHVRCRKCGGLMRVPGEALPAPRDNTATLKWILVGACAVLLSAGGIVAWSFLSKPARVVRTAPKTETPVTPETPNPETKIDAPSVPPVSTAPAVSQPKVSNAPLMQALLKAPENAVATAALINPAALLETVRASVEQSLRANPNTAGMVNLGISQIQAQTGLDVNNARTLGIDGLDLSQPLTAVVLGMLPDKAQPAGVAIGAGLSDAALFRKSVQKLHEKFQRPLTQLSATPEIYALDESSCLAIDGKEAFIIATDPERVLQQALVFLRVRKERRLQETQNMKIALQGAGSSGDFAMYVDLPRIFAALPEKPILANEMKGVALSYGKGGGWFMQLDRAGSLLPLLKPGPSPKSVLERFDAPLVTVAGSLSDPVKLLQQVLHSTKQGAQLIQIDNELRARTNLGLAELGDLLRDSASGFMLFKGIDRQPFSGVLFIKPAKNDAASVAQLKGLMERIAEQLHAALSPPGGTVVIPRPTISVIDGVVFATTAPQLLTNYQLAQTPRSKPPIEPDDFLFVEYRAGEVMQHMKQINPQMAQSPMQIDPNALVSMAMKRTPDGVKYYSSRSELDVATVSVIAAIAIPSLLRSRIAANETAAEALCRQLIEAQEIYKREDRDADGVLEYAQSFGGDFGLTKVNVAVAQSGNDQQVSPLLPLKYAKAEGNPGDPTTPVAGYCIKILKGQGERAKGGRVSFLAGKDMTAGHAAIVYPKSYDSTGRHTFILSHDVVIYQADLGPDTASIVELMTEFNPGPGWVRVE